MTGDFLIFSMSSLPCTHRALRTARCITVGRTSTSSLVLTRALAIILLAGILPGVKACWIDEYAPRQFQFPPLLTGFIFSLSDGVEHCSDFSPAARIGIGLGLCACTPSFSFLHITQKRTFAPSRHCPRAAIFIDRHAPASRRTGQPRLHPAAAGWCGPRQWLRRPAGLRTPIPAAGVWCPTLRVRPQLRIRPGSFDRLFCRSSGSLTFNIFLCYSLAWWLTPTVLPPTSWRAPSQPKQGAVSRLRGTMLSQGIPLIGLYAIFGPTPMLVVIFIRICTCCFQCFIVLAESYPILSLCLRACEPMSTFHVLAKRYSTLVAYCN